jgi:hypothetical protein
MDSKAPSRRPLRAILLFLLGSAVFAVAYCQAPLYYSNQNQYFLHGLANARRGLLASDWLASTRDPTPVFSALVTFTVEYLHPAAFYLYHALLLGAYAAALLGLFRLVAGPEITARRWPVFLALLVLFHAALPRWCSYRWLGQDYPWYLQAGVAGQYVLGCMLQPSVLGVLLVVAVCLFAHGRPFLAAVCVALAATLHPTYLLTGGLLTLGFLAALLVEGRTRQALATGALALVLVLPAAVWTATIFAPRSPGTFARAQELLFDFRIPHHCRPDLWLDRIAMVQILWMTAGLVLARPTRLRIALIVPFVLAALLTLLQVGTGSRTLALLFPWRVSSVLLPIATAILLSRLVSLPSLPLDGRLAGLASGVIIAVLAAGGVWIMADRQGFHQGQEEERGVMDFVARSKAPGDVYLLPVRIPNLAATTRGSLSSDFKPLPDKKRDGRVIPVDFQRFRLTTEAPIFVDFKAIPYKDTDLLEWYARLRLVEEVQEQLRRGDLPAAIAELHRLGITHLVWPATQELSGFGLVKVYEDTNYRVYRLTGRPEPSSAVAQAG